jgi:hypothetical protein
VVAPLQHAVRRPGLFADTRRFVEPHGIPQRVGRFMEQTKHPLAVPEMQVEFSEQLGVTE